MTMLNIVIDTNQTPLVDMSRTLLSDKSQGVSEVSSDWVEIDICR